MARFRALCCLCLASACAEPTAPRPALAPAAAPEPPARRPAEPAPLPPSVEAPPPAWPPRTPSDVATDWCTESVRGLRTDACYFLPDTPTTTLLIYLHGVVPPDKSSVQKTNYQAVVANASRRANAAALMPRGNQGLTPKEVAKWWGWPTSPDTYRRHGPELVERIVGARRELEAATGVRFERVYLAGSSSGAYFVATLAQRGAIDVDGYGAMSGGTRVLEPALHQLAPRPMYIGYGLYDTVGQSARELGKLLEGARWPVRIAEHRTGHGAREIYLDEAFPFWNEQAKSRRQ